MRYFMGNRKQHIFYQISFSNPRSDANLRIYILTTISIIENAIKFMSICLVKKMRLVEKFYI